MFHACTTDGPAKGSACQSAMADIIAQLFAAAFNSRSIGTASPPPSPRNRKMVAAIETPTTMVVKKTMTLKRSLLTVALVALVCAVSGQYDYDPQQDGGGDSYGQDSLYHDYAMRQQEKEVGGKP